MDKRELRNRIEYIVTVVSCFAERFRLSNAQAYAYLRRFNGIELLIKHYGVIHTQSLDDAVDDLQMFCYRHGGRVQ